MIFRKPIAAFLLLLAMPALAGCGTLGNFGNLAERPPAPLAQTTLDDQAVKVSYQSFDLALDAVNGLIDVGIIKPGSPTAKKLADLIEVVKASLNAATEAQRAGQSQSYIEAMERIRAAFVEMRVLIAKAT